MASSNCPAILGTSSLLGAERAALERRFGLAADQRPRPAGSADVQTTLLVSEAALVAYSALVAHWIFNVRQLDAAWTVSDGVVDSLAALNAHMVAATVVFGILLPQIMVRTTTTPRVLVLSRSLHFQILSIVFEISSEPCRAMALFLAKLAIGLLLLVGCFDVARHSDALRTSSGDLGAHRAFAGWAAAALVADLAAAAVHIAGYFHRGVFSVRLVGPVLGCLANGLFHDCLRYLNVFAQMLALLTGLVAYLFFTGSRPVATAESYETWIVRAIAALLIITYGALGKTIFSK